MIHVIKIPFKITQECSPHIWVIPRVLWFHIRCNLTHNGHSTHHHHQCKNDFLSTKIRVFVTQFVRSKIIFHNNLHFNLSSCCNILLLEDSRWHHLKMSLNSVVFPFFNLCHNYYERSNHMYWYTPQAAEKRRKII